MKLLSCHILAFGGIADRRIEFNEGINELCDKNGSGKSTLASFIKVMLYGLEGERKKTLADNERKLYAPWGGGRFGGSLTLSNEGKIYRIERFYDPDEFAVIDVETEKPTDCFGESVGEAILSVDADSFLKSIYLSSRGTRASATTNLTAKLTDLSGEIWDLGSYDKADRLLEDRRKEIALFRGRGGLLADGEDRLYALKEKKRDSENARGRALLAEEERKRQEALLSKIGEEKKAVEALMLRLHKQNAEKGQKELSLRLGGEIASAKEGLSALASRFTMGLPTEEEERNLYTVAEEERRLLCAYHDALLERRGEEEKYPSALPTQADCEKLSTLLIKENELKTKLYKEEEPKKESGNKKGLLAKLLPAALGVCLLVASFLLFKTSSLVASFLLCLAVALVGGSFLFAKKESAPKECPPVAPAEDESALLGEAIDTLLSRFFGKAGDHARAAAMLSEAVMRLSLLREACDRAKERHALKKQECETLFAPYASLGQDPALILSSLREAKKQKETLESLISEKEKTLASLPPPEGEKESEINATEEELSALYRGLTEAERRATEETARQAAIAEKENALAEELPLLLAEIEEGEETLAFLREKKEILDKTRKLLGEAKTALETRYLSGVRERFAHYAAALSPSLTDFTLDTDLSVGLVREGKSRESGYFSSGWQALIEICLRLSLLDALYPEGRPPLILDDPFALLDEENLSLAKKLLSSLPDCQILYLTAHESRSLSR